jgi:hypothetical protein
MKKMPILMQLAMLAAALTLTLPAFADKTTKANQSSKQTPVSKSPSTTPPKGGKLPLAPTISITSGSISPTQHYAPKNASSTPPKGGNIPLAPTTAITSAVPPAK